MPGLYHTRAKKLFEIQGMNSFSKPNLNIFNIYKVSKMELIERWLHLLSELRKNVQSGKALQLAHRGFKRCFTFLFISVCCGCAVSPHKLRIAETEKSYPPETIIETKTGRILSFDELISALETAEVIYIGEQHTNKKHHEIQLRIMKHLSTTHPDLSVGMEMFAHTYQPVLVQWSAQELTEQALLEKTHWYANWKFDFALYKDLLEFIKQHRVPLIGLNVPFYIPPKIAVGGIENLLPDEKTHLPETIDTSNEAHREYVATIFKKHHQPGLTNFEYFYEAQCVWEDAMAENIAKNLNNRPMLVFSGSGHLRHKYGIPLRAFRRNPLKYQTVLPIPAGQTVEASTSDYIWVTSGEEKSARRMPHND